MSRKLRFRDTGYYNFYKIIIFFLIARKRGFSFNLRPENKRGILYL